MCKIVSRKIEEFEMAGYTTIHILGRLYLIRRYSKNYKKFSLYDFCIMR
jgi:hypothetical protein